MRRLSVAEFAEESGATVEVVNRLVEIGAILPDADGRLAARDEVVASTVRGMLDAGIGLDDIAWTLEGGRFGIQSLGRIFSEPQPRTVAPFHELAAALGPSASLLPAVYAALGLPEPEADDRPRTDEAELVLEFVRLWSLVDPGGEAHVRVARQIGEGTRRIAETWLDVWDEVALPGPTTQGAPTVGPMARPTDPADPEQNPSIGMAELGRRLVALVHERQVEATLNARIVLAIERVLGETGHLPPRSARPPAVAFVDLSGFASLTEERGDHEAARAAGRLAELAEAAVRVHEGRLVKQLGDGVLLRFGGAVSALRAVRNLMDSAAAAALPAAHAGIAAGPLILRDGDVFGRTVNLAARLADVAGPGEVVVEEGVVVGLPAGVARFEPLGRISLDGFAEPVASWRAHAASPRPDDRSRAPTGVR